MRYLILSDIHGNWEALEAVLRDARGEYDTVLCCGDLVGYGADPNRVIDWSRECVAHVVRGNHDKGCAGLDDLEWFNAVARAAATWTAASLTRENMQYLRSLPQGPLLIDSFQIVHGSPLDEDEYVVSPGDAAQTVPYTDRELSFFGHTHLQGGFAAYRNVVRRMERPGRDERERDQAVEPNVLYLANPGSVGQPRDGDPRAAYLIYETEDRLLRFRRVAYEVEAAQAKIVRAGLPPVLAARLASGQ